MLLVAGFYIASHFQESKQSYSMMLISHQTGVCNICIVCGIYIIIILNSVFFLDVSEDTIKERLCWRRVDPVTGER